MSILSIIIISIAVVMINTLLNKANKEYTIFIRIFFCIFIFLSMSSRINEIMQKFSSILYEMNINDIYISTMLKVIVLAYLVEFGVEIAKDSNENTIASNLTIVGKLMIIYISLPILGTIIERIIRIIHM